MAKYRMSVPKPLAGLLFQAGILVLALLPIWWFDIPVALDGMTPIASLLWGCLGALVTYGLLLLMSLWDLLSPDSLQRHLRDLHRFVRSQRWPVLIGLAVLAGIGEELMFRGLIQGGLSSYLGGLSGQLVGIAAGSVLFGLAHGVSVAYFLVASALGLVFGIAYALTDSLLLVMVWHGAYDLLVIALLRWFPGLFGLRVR